MFGVLRRDAVPLILLARDALRDVRGEGSKLVSLQKLVIFNCSFLTAAGVARMIA